MRRMLSTMQLIEMVIFTNYLRFQQSNRFQTKIIEQCRKKAKEKAKKVEKEKKEKKGKKFIKRENKRRIIFLVDFYRKKKDNGPIQMDSRNTKLWEARLNTMDQSRLHYR